MANSEQFNLTETLSVDDVVQAQKRLKPYLKPTPLTYLPRFNQELGHNVSIKREDFQPVRSFKVRGALNKLLKLSEKQKEMGVVCASAGNHAQGLAYASWLLNVHCVVFLPKNTPKQKVNQVAFFGKSFVKIVLVGENFDECCQQALEYTAKNSLIFVHPFDDFDVIAGQGTLALEWIDQLSKPLDCILVPVGGGGLLAGTARVFKHFMPSIKVIGVELKNANAMQCSLEKGRVVSLDNLDTFADGTAVKQVGMRGFKLSQALVDEVLVLENVDVCQTLIALHNHHGIITEPSGALALAAASKLGSRGLQVGCVLSGSNNDAARYAEYYELLRA